MKVFFVFVLVLGLGACGTSKRPRASNGVSYVKIQDNLIRGQTSQSQVIQLMGSPNRVAKNAMEEEVWTYSQQSYNPENGRVAQGSVLSGYTQAGRKETTAAFDLIITFTPLGRVRDYSIISNEF